MQGPAGTPGQDGAPGANGAGIAARPELSAMFTAANTDAALSLTNATWTQKAGEVEMIVGSMTEDASACVPPSNSAPQIFLVYKLDGNELLYQTIIGGYGPTFSIPLPAGYLQQGVSGTNASFVGGQTPLIMDPSADTAHTLTMTARDNCTTSAHITISSMKLRVLRFL
ncbi:MAG TPA: hypothetical protein VL326_08745 [Kofleriaceae bacterium]|nr:hypothetical protein [Kofleriaceae bacterium]